MMIESKESDQNDVMDKKKTPREETDNPGIQMQVGKTCPRCCADKLIYNGLLQLTCPNCGLVEAGVNT